MKLRQQSVSKTLPQVDDRINDSLLIHAVHAAMNHIYVLYIHIYADLQQIQIHDFVVMIINILHNVFLLSCFHCFFQHRNLVNESIKCIYNKFDCFIKSHVFQMLIIIVFVSLYSTISADPTRNNSIEEKNQTTNTNQKNSISSKWHKSNLN